MEELVDLSFQLSDFVFVVKHAEDSSHHFVQDGLKKDNLMDLSFELSDFVFLANTCWR